MTTLPDVQLFAWVALPGESPRGVASFEDPRRCVVVDAGESPRLSLLDVFDPAQIVTTGARDVSTDLDAHSADVGARGDVVFAALGTTGLVAFDVSDPDRPVVTGRLPAAGEGTRVRRGILDARAVAVLGSSELCVSDRDVGLHIVSHASPLGVLSGRVLDASSDLPAESVTVRAGGRESRTNSLGDFRLGILPGSHDVVFEGFEFIPETRSATPARGEVITLDVSLDRRPTGELRGNASQLPRGGAAQSPRHPAGTIIQLIGTPKSTAANLAGSYAHCIRNPDARTPRTQPERWRGACHVRAADTGSHPAHGVRRHGTSRARVARGRGPATRAT